MASEALQRYQRENLQNQEEEKQNKRKQYIDVSCCCQGNDGFEMDKNLQRTVFISVFIIASLNITSQTQQSIGCK